MVEQYSILISGKSVNRKEEMEKETKGQSHVDLF